MKLKEYMTKFEDICFVCPETTLDKIATLLLMKQISSVLVRKETSSKKPLGIITTTDVIEAFITKIDPKEIKASFIMNNVLEYCEDTESREKIANAMVKSGFHHMLVCDDNKELVGLVSAYDLTKDIALDSRAPWLRNLLKMKKLKHSNKDDDDTVKNVPIEGKINLDDFCEEATLKIQKKIDLLKLDDQRSRLVKNKDWEKEKNELKKEKTHEVQWDDKNEKEEKKYEPEESKENKREEKWEPKASEEPKESRKEEKYEPKESREEKRFEPKEEGSRKEPKEESGKKEPKEYSFGEETKNPTENNLKEKKKFKTDENL
jgi:CBS domain-containing protein